MRHLGPVLLCAWILWAAHDGSSAPRSGFETKKDCEIGLRNELLLLERGGAKVVQFDTGIVRLSTNGTLITHFCLPDTIDPRKK